MIRAHVQNSRFQRQRRGTALVMAVLLSVIVTALVLAAAKASLTIAQAGSNLSKMDQAFYASESGAATVAWYCKNSKLGLITSPITGSIGGASYSTSWTTVSGSTIRITSTGTQGTVMATLAQTVTPPSSSPAFVTGGDLDGKNITITGDIGTNGNYSSGGVGSVSGNLTAAGTVSDQASIAGTITHASVTTLSIPTLVTTLQGSAGLTYNSAQSNKTFDFTAVPGTNKIIYVNGNVSNPTFIGSGTLVVTGTISVGAFGTSSNPVNLVATGDVTTGNNITLYGSIYTNGNWNRGKFDMTGVVYVSGISASNNGHSTLVEANPPWFDSRGSGSSGGNWPTGVFTNFAGPSI